MDQLVGVGAVAREGRNTDRDGGADGLAGRFDVEFALRNCAPDPLGDLERLLGRSLGEQNRELLAAEAGRNVVVTELDAKNLRDPLEHRIAGEVAVGVVDVSQEVEVGHDQRQRPFEALRPPKLLREGCCEVPGVEEACLRVHARLGLELRNAEGAVNQQERSERERDQPGIPAPESREAHAECREHEVGRKALEREQAAFADRVAVSEVEQRREQHVVDRDEREAGCDARKGKPHVACPRAHVQDEVGAPPRRQVRERVVTDVERLGVPGAPVFQPFGKVLHDPEQRHELGWKQERRGNQEHDRRVVRLVPGRPDDEELRDRGERSQDREADPALCVPVDPGDERAGRRAGNRGDENDVGDRARGDLRPVGGGQVVLALEPELGRDRTHGARPPEFKPARTRAGPVGVSTPCPQRAFARIPPKLRWPFMPGLSLLLRAFTRAAGTQRLFSAEV